MPRVEPTERAPRAWKPRAAAGLVAAWLASVPAVVRAEVVRLGPWTGFAEFRVDFQDQDQVVGDRSRPLFTRTFAEERTGFRNNATIVDPRIAAVNFGAVVGFQRNRLATVPGQSDSGTGRLLGFDLTATMLSRKPYAFTLTAGRTETVRPVEFAGSRELRASNLGLTVGLGTPWYPGMLRYRSFDTRSISEFASTLRSLDQSRRALTHSGQNSWRRHGLHTFVEFQDLEDRVAERTSNRTLTASLNHDLELLAPRLVTLRTTVRHFDREGELESSSFHVSERLQMRHSATLSSGLLYDFRRQEDFSGSPTESRRRSVWLQHRLWESLETEVRFGEQTLTSTLGHSDFNQARLRANYRKRLPRGGTLRGLLSTNYEKRDNQHAEGEELVTQERHSVRFGVPTRLERPRVVPGSVVVTDELESTIFEEGFDYELRSIGEFSEILPLPGGNLGDGDTVFVSYRVESPVLTKFASSGMDLFLLVDYDWIAPFIGYRRFDDRRLAGQPHSLFEDRTDRIVGVRLKTAGPRLRLFSFNEWRSRASGLLAFESLRIADGVIYNPALDWRISVNLVHIDTRFEVSPREVRIRDGRIAAVWRPTPTLNLRAYGHVRATSDTRAADQTLSRAGVEARWILGKISAIASIEQWRRERDGTRLDGVRASLRLSRRFFPGSLAEPRRAVPLEPWPDDLPGSLTGRDGGEAGEEAGELEEAEIVGLPGAAGSPEGEEPPAEPPRD